MTAGERLAQLAGSTGTAAALLLLIGSGITSGDALVNHSRLSTGAAAQHLLVDRVVESRLGGGGGGGGRSTRYVEQTVALRQDKDIQEILFMAIASGVFDGKY